MGREFPPLIKGSRMKRSDITAWAAKSHSDPAMKWDEDKLQLVAHRVASLMGMRGQMDIDICIDALEPNEVCRELGLTPWGYCSSYFILGSEIGHQHPSQFFIGVNETIITRHDAIVKLVEVLAHEFQHIKQFNEGRLYYMPQNPEIQVFEGEYYFDYFQKTIVPMTAKDRYHQYRTWPWEIEAREVAVVITRKYFEKFKYKNHSLNKNTLKSPVNF